MLGDTSAREGVSESANEVAFVSLLQSPLHGLKRRPKTSALLALKGLHLHSTSLVNKWPLNTRARSALLPMCKIGGGHAFLPHSSVRPSLSFFHLMPRSMNREISSSSSVDEIPTASIKCNRNRTRRREGGTKRCRARRARLDTSAVVPKCIVCNPL